jgi:hypothetical protein
MRHSYQDFKVDLYGSMTVEKCGTAIPLRKSASLKLKCSIAAEERRFLTSPTIERITAHGL